MIDHDQEALALLALGRTDQTDPAVQQHLNGCSSCRQELNELREVTDALGEVPPELFLDGPAEDGGLVLGRALGQVRRERRRSDGLRHLTMGAAAAAVALVAIAGGVLIGLKLAQTAVLQAPPPSTSSSQAQPPGTRFASAADAATGAAMTVRLVPAAGWVRLNLAVTGIPAGQTCRIWVVDDDGRRVQAGSWLVSDAGARDGTTLDGAAAVPPERVAAIEVDNVTGHRFVSVTV